MSARSNLIVGGSNEGQPGLRGSYQAHFYVACLRDPQGNKIATRFMLCCINAPGYLKNLPALKNRSAPGFAKAPGVSTGK